MIRIFTPFSPIRIFISYYRIDSAASSGLLFNYLREYFGKKNVYKDVNFIEGGDSVSQKIKTTIENSDVVLMVIGQYWIDVQKRSAFNQTNEIKDWVRYEIETAMEKCLILIPVLVDNASMPKIEFLPDTLKQINDINAAELAFKHYEHDIKNLIKDIKKKVKRRRKNGLRLFNILLSLPIFSIILFGIIRLIYDGKHVYIGKKLNGGIVFFIDSSKQHGLICANEDISSRLSWRKSLEACKAYRAGGFKDWRLPTKDEIIEIYSKRNVIGNFFMDCNPSNFGNCSYWTSTEMLDTAFAWNFYFTRGIFWDNFGKDGLARVRPVRSFRIDNVNY